MNPRAITRGLRRLFNAQAADLDLDDEIAQYIAAATEEHVRSGMSRAEAVRRARLEFGGVESAKEAVRDAGWEAIPERLRRDLGFSIRTLARSPGFSAAVLITLALGIGATTAMFTVLNAVLLRPLPYHDPGKLALIWTDDVRRALHQEPTAFLTIQDWRREARSLQSIAYFSVQRGTMTESGQRATARISFVSGNTFSVLGVNAALGRTLTAADEERAEPVAVISYGLWQREFHGDSQIVGRTLVLEGGPKAGGGTRTIIGVMPPSFYFPYRQTDIWMPATLYWRFETESIDRFSSSARRWTVVGRLRDEATIDEARAELGRIAGRLTANHSTTIPDFPGFATTIMPILDSVAARNLRTAMWVLMGGVSLVLLVACANVANLLLARGASRRHELRIRQALGASRARLIGQLLTDSLVLALVGGAGGVALAWSAVRLVVGIGAAQVPRLAEATIDTRVLAFSIAVAVIAGLVFGLAPAVGVTGSLNVGVKGTRTGHSRQFRDFLVITECALAIVLLAGAGLLLRSLGELRGVNPGFDPSRVLAVRIEYPPEQFGSGGGQPGETADQKVLAGRRQAISAELARRVGAIAGVRNVGFSDDLFIAGTGNESIAIPGRPDLSTSAGELVESSVSSGFFDVLRVPLLQGRYLVDNDVSTKIASIWGSVNNRGTLGEREARADFEPVVVNAEFARRFFPGENPIGKHFCTDPTGKTYWYTIVGVVGDMRRQGLAKGAIAQYFGPWFPMPMGRVDLLVRTAADPLSIAGAVRRAVNETIPGAIIASVTTVDAQLGAFHAQRDFQALLLTIFAVLAIALAGVGIYGVVHYTVSERTQEMGVRIALGATPSGIRALVVREGLRGPVVGIGIGILAALAATQVLSATLFGISATDPATYVGVGVLLLAVAAIACLIPAVRATRVDPIAALRQD